MLMIGNEAGQENREKEGADFGLLRRKEGVFHLEVAIRAK